MTLHDSNDLFQRAFKGVSAFAIALGGLAACGGGGNESGPIDQVIASPSAVEVSGSPTTCFWGQGPTVFVYGGQPPYKLYNSAPGAMALDRTMLWNSGDGFTLTFWGDYCLNDIPITIEDDDGRVITVPVTNQLGEGR